jgi:hypothetical protein
MKEAFHLPWNEIEEALITGRKEIYLISVEETDPDVVIATKTKI